MSAADPSDVPPRPEWLPEHLFPLQGVHVGVDAANVHYVDEGDGPVLLLMHGNPTYSFLYRELITGLREWFRCIAIDYRDLDSRWRHPATDSPQPSMPTSSRRWFSAST